MEEKILNQFKKAIITLKQEINNELVKVQKRKKIQKRGLRLIKILASLAG